MPANSYEIIEELSFEKQKQEYTKTFPSLNDEIEDFKKVLLARPDDGKVRKSLPVGDPHPKIFLRKSRMLCKSLGGGQKRGFRVWYAQDIQKRQLRLLGLYPKKDEDQIEAKELNKYLQLLTNA